MGIDFVAVLTFTPKLAATNARDFVLGLREHLRMRAMVIGPGFALGREREGDELTLRSLGEEFDFTVEVVSPMTIDGEVVSSTSIRNALSIGDMARVRRFLGRPFTLDGQVVPGREGGKGLGFPTANLAVDEERAIPADGVYITRAYLDGRPYNSVTNIGTRPTFGEGERVVETYILDFDGDIYAHWLSIELLERMRGEMRFASGKELGEQIARDVQRAREWLEHHGD